MYMQLTFGEGMFDPYILLLVQYKTYCLIVPIALYLVIVWIGSCIRNFAYIWLLKTLGDTAKS